jgi:AcrR family transcriptional regulator
VARPRQFTDEQILDAARDLLAEAAVTHPSIAQISRASGVHSGSIYLRFASRDELLARLWARSIQRFHAGFVAALEGPDPLLNAALHLTGYCRDHPTEARAMKMFHQRQLLGIGPDEFQHTIAGINDTMMKALLAAVRRSYGRDAQQDPELYAWVDAAVKAIPYGLIRDYIARAEPIPLWVDDAVRTATGAMLRTGPPPD